MVRFRIRKGLGFFGLNGRHWVVERRTVTGKLMLISETSDEVLKMTDVQIYSKISKGEWWIDEKSLEATGSALHYASPKDLKALSEKARQAVNRKLAYLRACLSAQGDSDGKFPTSPKVLSKAIIVEAARLADPKPPSPITVYKWWRKYAYTRCPTRLADARRGRSAMLQKKQQGAFEDAICEVYLKAERPPIKEVVSAVKEKIDRLNQQQPEGSEHIRAPSRATIYRWVRDLYGAVVKQARDGSRKAEREFREAMEGVKVRRLLERVELDHTPLDLNVICPQTNLVLGRPWLTMMIDRLSRMILGFYISFHAPSATSVLYCLRMAIQPKEQVLEAIGGTSNPWPCYGIPNLLALDNGMEEHSLAVQDVCADMGVTLLFCPAGKPWFKGSIERLFRTVSSDLIHQLPGTVFSSPDQRGDYDSEKHACLDLESVTKILVKWIVDDYHTTAHRGLGGKTPLQVWNEQAQHRDVDLPAYPRQLDTMVGHSVTRTVFHYGVEYDSIHYNSSMLMQLRRRGGGAVKVEIRAYEHDCGYVDVYVSERREFIRVDAVHQDYALGLNRAAHRVIRHQVLKRFGENADHQAHMEVKAFIQNVIEMARVAKKTRHRKAAAALLQTDSARALNQRADEALHTAMTEGPRLVYEDAPLLSRQPASALPRFGVSNT